MSGMKQVEFLGCYMYPWQADVFQRVKDILDAGQIPKVVQHPRGGFMVIGVDSEPEPA